MAAGRDSAQNSGRIYDEYFVSIALPQDNPFRKPINKALLNLMKTKNWTELLNRYIQ